MPSFVRPYALSALFFAFMLAGPAATLAADGCSAADFQLARGFDAGGAFTAKSYAAVDLNNDGRPDLVAADSESAAVVVLLNDGTGWLGEPRRFSVQGTPSALAVADFNNDGRPDLAVTNQASHTVSLMLGLGGGQFGPASHFPVPNGPRTLAVADFNNDGRPDLAVGSIELERVSVLLGDGAGSLLPAGEPVAFANDIVGVAVADFNTDGRADLAVTTSQRNFLMRGDGAGGFTASAEVGGNGGRANATADVNGDGKADLLIGGFEGLTVRLGDGAGNFSASAVFRRDGGGDIEAITLGDLDGDGKLDAAVAGGIPGLTYFKGDGAGGFTSTRAYLTASFPNSVAIADFDGDGDTDIAAGNSLLFNTGGGAFAAARVAYTGNSAFGVTASGTPTDLALGDFNGDGRQDFAISHRGQSGVSPAIIIMLDDGAGGYTRSAAISYFPASILNRVVTADFNNDGKTDVAAAASINGFISPIGAVSVSLGNGDGTFGSPLNTNISGLGLSPWDLAVGNFNGDATPDLFVSINASTAVLLGQGNGLFSVHAGPSGIAFDRVAVGNFNADAHQDFVLTDRDDRRVIVALGSGGGGFNPPQSIEVTGFPNALAVGDFNGDGQPDIAVASLFSQTNNLSVANDGSVSILLGQGTGDFTLAASYRIGPAPEDMAAADFDGDGNLDLAVGDRTSGSLYVLSGDGAGAFSNAAAYDFTGGRTAFAAHDLDGDTRPDLAGLVGTNAVGLLFSRLRAPLPCLLADDASVTEGDAGTTNINLTVRLSGASGQPVRVNYQLRSGLGITGAAEGPDFTGGTGSLTFEPGETMKTVSVGVIGDNLDELDESFTLHLSAPLGARLSDRVARVQISDDDPPPAFSINDVVVTEGNFSSTDATFTVTLSAPSALPTRVDYAVTAGTATAFVDFTATQGTLFFGSGETSKTFNVIIAGDLTHEPDETFTVTLSNPADATIADGQGQGTILNDDPLPAVSVLNFVGSEGNGADTTATASFRLANPSSLPVSVDYATADDTATAGSDYVAATGTVTFDPGQVERTVSFIIKDDAVDEAVEIFFVNLSNPVNAAIADAQAFGQIVDNDGPVISVGDVTVVEGQSGRTSAVFNITLSAPSPEGITVRASTANGTASAAASPPDFQSFINRPVSFSPGATTATVTVLVNGDHVIEPDETFFLNLSQPQGGTIADGQGVGTITNDDTTSVRFSTDAVTVNESDGKVEATVMRVGDTASAFTAFYLTFSGTASERTDFNTVLGTLRFEPGETEKTVTVFITNDVHVEDPEQFFIQLSGATGGATTPPSLLQVTINSEDATLGPNPVDSSQFFVRQHYRDFLSRDPDAPGLAFWTGEIEGCGADQQCREVKRINVSAAFFLSIEFQETGYLAYRTHKAAFGDATSPNVPGTVPIINLFDFLLDAGRIGRGVEVGVGNWQQQLEANKEAYVTEFVQRQQFVNEFPLTMTAEQFVDKLDTRAGGVLSAEERAELLTLLGATPGDAQKRAPVLRRVAEDADLRQRETNRAFVLMQYFGYLRRNPDDPQDTDFRGWRFWLDKLEAHNGNFVSAEMVRAFISSIEYRQRFGQ